MNASIIRLATAGLLSAALSACNPPDAPADTAPLSTADLAPAAAPVEVPAARVAPAPSVVPTRAPTNNIRCEAERLAPPSPTFFAPRDPQYRAPVGEESAHKGPPAPVITVPAASVTAGP